MLMSLFLCLSVSAQTSNAKIEVKGSVTDGTGEPLIGASVAEKGTTNGVMTDDDGKFSISIPKNGVLVFTYVGFITKDVPVNGKTTVNIVMDEDSKVLDEVVVTALGIKRETKSLGYAMQELKGEALLESRESNVANALSGKVAGLQVVRSGNGLGGSSKIILRGTRSLTGSNQPLIVVDGVPMDNFTGGVSDPYGNSGTDMGNGLADINPEDIESMSVLKGASAAALYGARAGNGAILITTKSGKKNPGVGITFVAGLSIESAFMKPELQNSYGQGDNGIYKASERTSWGAKMDGQSVKGWNGEQMPYQAYDNFDAFFKTGIAFNEGVSFQQEINGTSVFASVNRSDETGTVPEAKLNKTSLTLRGTTFLDAQKKWRVDAKANYINMIAHNRPIMGINSSNVYRTVYTLPRSIDLSQFKHNVTDIDGKMVWWDPSASPQENPYWVTQYRQNEDKRDRLLGNIALKYAPFTWLDVEVKAGTDYYTTQTEQKVYAGGPIVGGGGSYGTGSETFYENNYSFLSTARKDNLIDRLGGFVSVGGNLMFQGRRKLTETSGELMINNLFSMGNAKGNPSAEATDIRRQMNSLYGQAQLNWDNYAYLDITARNDWSSTLSKENRSYFYPSFSLSYVVSEMLNRYEVKMPSWLTFAKVRASYAQVGNDLDPYQLWNYMTMKKDGLGGNLLTPNETLFNADVKSELVKSWEAGIDLRFLDGRIGLDAAWYKANSTRQLLNIDLSPFSGYKNMKVNAGDIQNVGYEIALNGIILDNPQSLSWDATANFSSERTKILKLADNVDTYPLLVYDNIKIVATEGSRYGDIYGTTYSRVQDKNSEHYGKIIVDAEGLPVITGDQSYLGNQNPDWMLGITNNFSYKGIHLSFLVDARVGGKIFSGTTAILNRTGNGIGTVVNGERNDFVVANSVVSDGSGGYVENNKAVQTQKYWERLANGNLGLGEEYIYDATNVRLRNITIGYDLNKKWLANTPFQRVRVSATCNNVWMIHSNLPGIDPESVAATNTNATGLENMSAPTNRSFVFNVTVGF